MADPSLFYLGGLGALVQLPDLAGPVAAPIARTTGTRTSLSGYRSADHFARQRSWTWKWDMLLPWQVVYLESLALGNVPGPLRLIDPRRPNRWPDQIATGGSTRRDPTRFGCTAGLLGWTPLSATTAAAYSSLGPRRVLRGAVTWALEAGGGELYGADPNGPAGRWIVPVLPSDTVEGSVWALGPTGMVVTPCAREYTTAAGAYMTRRGLPVTLSATVWTRVSLLEPVASTVIGVNPYLEVPSTAAAGTITTTAWQVAAPDLINTVPAGLTSVCTSPADDPAAGWRPGGGAPTVRVEGTDAGYLEPGLYSDGLTLVDVTGS